MGAQTLDKSEDRSLGTSAPGCPWIAPWLSQAMTMEIRGDTKRQKWLFALPKWQRISKLNDSDHLKLKHKPYVGKKICTDLRPFFFVLIIVKNGPGLFQGRQQEFMNSASLFVYTVTEPDLRNKPSPVEINTSRPSMRFSTWWWRAAIGRPLIDWRHALLSTSHHLLMSTCRSRALKFALIVWGGLQ